jgi:hypothetical protein
MKFKTCRQHAATCFRLAIDAGDPEISQQLVAIAGEWLAQAAQAELENLERSSISQHPAMASQLHEGAVSAPSRYFRC